jgi:hypothetical protein
MFAVGMIAYVILMVLFANNKQGQARMFTWGFLFAFIYILYIDIFLASLLQMNDVI